MKVHQRISRKSFFSKLGAVAGGLGVFGFIRSSKDSVASSGSKGTNTNLLARFRQSSGSVKTKTLS